MVTANTPPRPSNGHGGPADSPRAGRSQRGSQDEVRVNGVGGATLGEASPAQLEQLRQEIVSEMRREIGQMKAEIISGESGRDYSVRFIFTHM